QQYSEAGELVIYLNLAREHGARITHILETHVHADFVSGGRELAHRTGAPIGVGATAEVEFDHQALEEGYEINLGRLVLRVLHTPGHTEGSVCLILKGAGMGEVLFSGDTLFRFSVGRTDLPGGSEKKLRESVLHRLYPLPDGLRVYPGHGEPTTIGEEKLHNDFVRLDTL
ncbi:MAG: MBL fold metallo-hydrolase, partial [Spirochaetota bacterium]